MKRLATSLIIFILLTSCLSDEQYEEYNIDRNNPTAVEADFVFNSALKSLADQMVTPSIFLNVSRMLSQYWATTTYPGESNYNFDNSNTPDNHWAAMYRFVFQDLITVKDIVMADVNLSEAQKLTRIAQADILEIYGWQNMVDTFGDIPYTDALRSDETTQPVYDDAASIYEDLINRIDVAISNLNSDGFEIDNLYFGDIDAWRVFAVSLKLRLGIMIADINPSLAQTTVENAYGTGVFTSNADNASFAYLGTSNPNPIWTDVVQSGRQDFIIANTITDLMNALDDPRRDVYFSDNLGPGIYDGGIYGDFNTFDSYTQIAETTLDPTYPLRFIDFAEVSFYLAEAAERGFEVGGTAEDYYNQGITASFEDWGAQDISTYLANPDVAYSTAQGDWRQKIGTQFWLAMYNRGHEGWNIWRKFDYPQLNLPAISGNPIPLRHRYPVNEQNLNESNYSAASSAIGGDAQSTRIFWDTQ